MTAQMNRLRHLSLALFFLLTPAVFASDAMPVPTSVAFIPRMSAEEIVERLRSSNEQRAAALRAYDGNRTYSLSYRGFPSNHDAAEEVVVHYTAPGSKNFEVVAEHGSKMLRSKVFAKLLEGEREAAHAENQRQTALTEENYAFTLIGQQPSPYGGCYRLGVEPRHESKFLYRGEICVNAKDFAVESIDAEPAKNPSFWIKKTRIEHRYQKIGEFWLPASNKTVSNVRLGGSATLSISYSAYSLR